MFVSKGVLGLKPASVILPSEIAVHLAKLAEKREMEIGDPYNTFCIITWIEPWGFCMDYDNKGNCDGTYNSFRLPITVEWELERIDDTNVIFSPYAMGSDFNKFSGLSFKDDLWLKRMTECLPQIGFTNKSVDTAKIVKIHQQSWNEEEGPFYCLESELSEIVGDYVRGLLKTLGVQIPH